MILICVVFVGCGEHNEPRPPKEDGEREEELPITPQGLIALGKGRFLELNNNGCEYTRVIFTPGTFEEGIARKPQNKYLEFAKDALKKHTVGGWIEYGSVIESGRLIFTFRRPYPKDMIKGKTRGAFALRVFSCQSKFSTLFIHSPFKHLHHFLI